MKSVFLLFILGSAFGYFLEDPKISSYSFRRYVKPQARNIIQDYDTLFKLFEGKIAQSYPLNQSLEAIFKSFLDIKTSCPTYLSVGCIKSINEISKDSIQLEKEFSKFQKQIVCTEENIETCLSEIRKSGAFEIELLKFISDLEETYLLIERQPQLFLTEELFKNFKQLQYIYHIFQIGLLDKKYQSTFLETYLFYIRPMGLWYKTDREDKEFLVKNLENFNKIWNEFNFNMSKKLEKETPKSVLVLVRTMHNRWNSILRIILRQ